MARVLNVFCALLMCVVFSQLSQAFPSFKSYDPYYDYYDDCAECGYIAYPDEHLGPIQVIQGGPTCHRCPPLSYQVQLPVSPPAAPCGQQYGVKVEVPYSAPCNPCMNVGYEIETPITPYTPKLPALPVSVTVPAPHYDCHQPCRISYEVETPVTPCTPLLTNLKTQVDRVVLPCPCSPPIREGYVPEPEPSTRRKRFVDCQECDDTGDEDDDDFADESRIRRGRTPANWRPSSSSDSRSELFPASRTDQSRRSEWMMDDIDYGDESELIPQNRGSLSTSNQRRIVGRGFENAFNDYVFGNRREDRDASPDTNDGGRVMMRGSRSRNDDGRIVSRSLDQDDDRRILSRGLDEGDDGRIVSRGLDEGDDGRIVSRGLVDDGSQWRPEVSSNPVDNRRQNPDFFDVQQPYYMSTEDRMLIDSLLSTGAGGSEQSEVVNAQLGTSGGTGGPTVVDNVLGAVRSPDPPNGRYQPSRNRGSQQNVRAQSNNDQATPNRTRLNGSSGNNRRFMSQSSSQNRITTPSTNRMNGRNRSQGSSDSEGQNDVRGQGSRQGMGGSQRMGSSNGLQRASGTQPTRNMYASQQRGGGGSQSSSQQRGGGTQTRGGSPQRGGNSQTGGGSPQRGGRSQSQSSSEQGRIESRTESGTRQSTGTSQTRRGSQQRMEGSQTQGGSQQRTGGSQQRQGGRPAEQRQLEPQRVGGRNRQRVGEPHLVGGSQRQNGSQDWTASTGSQQSPSYPNSQQRDSPSNSNTGRREVRLPGYLDYPEQMDLPTISGLPLQQMTSPVLPRRPWSSLNNQPAPPQPPSPLDATRIVTPTTYDEQPSISDDDYY